MRGGKLFLALAVVTIPLLARAQEPQAVPCEGFVIGYDGPAKQRSCVVVDVEQGTQTYKSSQLTVIDHAFFILTYYIESGFKTYLPQHTLQEMTDSSRVFDQTGDWREPRTIQGFDVAVFNGVLKGRQIPSICAVISRYSGDPGNQVDYSLGPGFKNHFTGYYCAVAESLTPAQQGDGFYAVVQDVIGKLRLPPIDQ
jgi:hypothetical protein